MNDDQLNVYKAIEKAIYGKMKMKIFIYCQNFARQIYEPLMIESKSVANIIGLFTTIDDLKDAYKGSR